MCSLCSCLWSQGNDHVTVDGWKTDDIRKYCSWIWPFYRKVCWWCSSSRWNSHGWRVAVHTSKILWWWSAQYTPRSCSQINPTWICTDNCWLFLSFSLFCASMSNQERASISGDQWVSFPISMLVLWPPGTLMMRKRIQPSASQDEHDCLHAAF